MNIFVSMSIINLLATLLLTACSGNSNVGFQNEIAMANTTGARVISEAEFKKLVMDYENNLEEWVFVGELPVIVSFTADWCPPCRRMNPILDQLAREYAGRINIYRVDVDRSRRLAGVFGIQSVPTLLFSPMKGLPALQPGAMTREQLVNVIENFLLKE